MPDLRFAMTDAIDQFQREQAWRHMNPAMRAAIRRGQLEIAERAMYAPRYSEPASPLDGVMNRADVKAALAAAFNPLIDRIIARQLAQLRGRLDR